MIDQGLQNKWDAKYRDAAPPEAAYILRENQHLLPTLGTALDLACGLGANSILLAEHGLKTYAWDISSVAVEKIRLLATQRKLPIVAEVRDLALQALPPGQFDVIVIAHYLERPLIPSIIAALRPGGLLFFQTFTRLRVHTDAGPQKDEWLLADGELLSLFQPLRPVVYREERLIGDLTRGYRDKAALVAVKTHDNLPHACIKSEMDFDD